MSKSALTQYLNQILAEVPVSELGKVASASERTNTASFRKNLNKTIHILIVNEYFIKSLAPRAEEILKSLPSAIGKDGNASAIKAILTEYRRMRGNKRGRVRKKDFDGISEPGYVLTFPSFDAVRSFLSNLGLKGRSSELLEFSKSNNDVRAKLETLLGKDIFTDENTFISSLARLSPEKNKTSSDEFYNNKEAFDLYRIIYDEDLGFDVGHNIPVAYKQVEILATNKEYLNSVVTKFTQSIGNKLLTSREINSIVKEVQKSAVSMAKDTAVEYNFVINKSELDAKHSGSVSVFIESSKANQETESEARIINQFKELILTRIKSHLRTDKAALKLLNQKGSKSYKEQYLDIAAASILGTKVVKETKSTAKSKLSSKVNTSKASISTIGEGVQSVKIKALRAPSGKFTSLLNIENLIKIMLTETVIKNMERPNLRNQTGRFARSVELIKVSQRGQSIQAFLTYMKYPYQTFEPGFKQGHKGYDPRRLIDQSVREIATKIVKARLQTVFV